MTKALSGKKISLKSPSIETKDIKGRDFDSGRGDERVKGGVLVLYQLKLRVILFGFEQTLQGMQHLCLK